jgi:hypothetical protein
VGVAVDIGESVDEDTGGGTGFEVSVTVERSVVIPGAAESGPQAEAASITSRDRASRRVNRMIC